MKLHDDGIAAYFPLAVTFSHNARVAMASPWRTCHHSNDHVDDRPICRLTLRRHGKTARHNHGCLSTEDTAAALAASRLDHGNDFRDTYLRVQLSNEFCFDKFTLAADGFLHKI